MDNMLLYHTLKELAGELDKGIKGDFAWLQYQGNVVREAAKVVLAQNLKEVRSPHIVMVEFEVDAVDGFEAEETVIDRLVAVKDKIPTWILCPEETVKK